MQHSENYARRFLERWHPRLAELMSGSSGANSTPGDGSTFWFTALLKKDSAPEKPAAQPALANAEQEIHRHHQKRRILIVDDAPMNLEVAQLLLTDSGLVTDTAQDGEQAINKASENRYDVILMDMQMPILDGLEATRLIRKLPGYQATPILAMTANTFPEDRIRCQEAGMNDFLPKPLDPKVFFATVLKWLEHGESRSHCGSNLVSYL